MAVISDAGRPCCVPGSLAEAVLFLRRITLSGVSCYETTGPVGIRSNEVQSVTVRAVLSPGQHIKMAAVQVCARHVRLQRMDTSASLAVQLSDAIDSQSGSCMSDQ